MRQHRDRAQIVHTSQSTRLIRVCAGTTHCWAGEKDIRDEQDVPRRDEVEILYERCAGLDVHKKNVKVCLKTPGSDGRPSQEVRTYATMTQTILEMGDWLKEQGCSHVALESTGVYWKPRYNLLEEDCEILVVNAHHLKTVPVSPESAEESLSKPRLSWQAAIVLLMSIPGISERAAQCILAEIGLLMQQFPSAQHLASWAGMCPGNNESAGKRFSGKTRKGNPWLRRVLIQAAHAAAHSKNTYLAAQYRRIASRRGGKRAAMAVAHTILVIIYHLLSEGTTYQELGGNFFDERDRQAVEKRLVRRLERLGYQVELQPVAQAG